MKESKFNNIVWGLVLIILGIIFLGNSCDLWNINVFFEGWWTLFIIVPSVLGLFKHGARLSSLFGVCIGIVLFLGCQDIINWDIIGKMIFPIILIFVGVSFIFKPKYKTCSNKDFPKMDEKDKKSLVAVFSGREENYNNKSFKGADLVSVFGGIDLDLRKAKITNDVVIEGVSVFGGVEILVPDDVNIVIDGVPFFGGVDNKSNNKDDNRYTVYINYVCIFGGIDIK